MTAPTTTHQGTLGDLVSPVARHRVLVVVCGLVGLLIGLLWSAVQPPAFQSTATVQLAPGETRVDLTDTVQRLPLLSVDSDAQMLLSDQVIDAVAQASGVDPTSVADRLSVQAPPASTTLRVGFVAPDPESAERGAEAAALTLIDVRSEVVASVRDSVADGIRAELARQEAALPNPDMPSRVESSLIADAGELSVLLDRLESEPPVSSLLVGEATQAQAVRSLLDPPRAGGGLMLGALAGFVLAWLLDRRRPPSTLLSADNCRPDLLRDAVRHHRSLIAGAVVAATVLGAAGGWLVRPDASATATVVVTRQPGNAFAPGDKRRILTLLENEAQIVRSDPVLSGAVEAAGVDMSSSTLRRRTNVSVPAGSETLKVRVRANSAERAELLATSVVDQYLQFRGELAEQEQDRVTDALAEQVVSLEQRLETYLAVNDEQFQSQVDVLSARLAQARGDLQALLRSGGNTGSALNLVRSEPPALISPTIGLVVGALIGLAVGVSIAVVRERVLDPVRRADCLWNYGLQPFAASTAVPEIADLVAGQAPQRAVTLIPVGDVADSVLVALRAGLSDASVEVRRHAGAGRRTDAVLVIHPGSLSHTELAAAVRGLAIEGVTVLGAVVVDDDHALDDRRSVPSAARGSTR